MHYAHEHRPMQRLNVFNLTISRVWIHILCELATIMSQRHFIVWQSCKREFNANILQSLDKGGQHGQNIPDHSMIAHDTDSGRIICKFWPMREKDNTHLTNHRFK